MRHCNPRGIASQETKSHSRGATYTLTTTPRVRGSTAQKGTSGVDRSSILWEHQQTNNRGGCITVFGGKRFAETLGPMDTVIANKFIKTLSVAEEPPKGTVQAQEHERKGGSQPNNTFKMGTELMYGGQGNITSNINLMSVNATKDNEGVLQTRATLGQKTGASTTHARTILMKK